MQASRNICFAYRSGVNKQRQKYWSADGNPDHLSDTMSEDLENGNGVTEEEEITQVLMSQTVTALRMFVNDELNELNFALRRVAAEFLKPCTGTVIAIIHTVSLMKLDRICCGDRKNGYGDAQPDSETFPLFKNILHLVHFHICFFRHPNKRLLNPSFTRQIFLLVCNQRPI